MPQQVYPEDYSCIIEPVDGKGGLFIGNLEASQNLNTLRRHQVKAILTAAKGVELGHSKTDIPYFLYVPADDHESFDITSNYINDCLQRTNIMVHCLAGVSRSVSLVLAYFIKHLNYPYHKAFDYVKSKRRIIHPNEGFIEQLKKFQKQVCSNGDSKSFSSSPLKRSIQRQNSLSFSPTKKYTPSREIEAIISKYQNYKTLAYKDVNKNPETPLELKKIQSSPQQASNSPEKSHFRAKRVASMNIQKSQFFESRNEVLQSRQDLSNYNRKRVGSEYNPLESIQNRQGGYSYGMSQIDKKIQEIRKKYQEYQTGSVSNYSRYTSSTNENTTRGLASNPGYERDYLKFIHQRRELIGDVSTTRLKRPPSFQEY